MGITKKVRMDQREADRLARVARQLKMTETDVLREGLMLLEQVQEGKLSLDGVRFGAADLRRMLAEFESHFEH